MRGLGLRLQCMLTGHNYVFIRQCSEGSVKAVKKYFAGMLLVMISWTVIGAAFAYRYLGKEVWIPIVGALLMAFVVFLIERQIILTVSKNRWALIARVILGGVMALLGSVILDQFILREDIEKRKIETTLDTVARILPAKAAEINGQIKSLDEAIAAKEAERAAIIDEVTKKPTISTVSTTIKQGRTGTGRMGTVGREITTESIPNPKAEMIPQIDQTIANLRAEKNSKEEYLLRLRENVEAEVKGKTGFLDEIMIVKDLIFSSGTAFTVWLLWFLLFGSIEMMVALTKIGDDATDYDRQVEGHMNCRIQSLDALYSGRDIALNQRQKTA